MKNMYSEVNEMSDGAGLGLDVAAGLRQAIGIQFERSEVTPKRLALLKQGEILLPPHPKWKGDFTDWTADPYSDRNWKFQFHTLRWINPLVWAALDGDQESKEEWLGIVKSWYKANVPAKSARSPFAWKDMADGNRAVQLCIGASLPSSDDHWFVELLEAHRDWLIDDENIVLGNHALHQNIGLFVVGAVLRDSNAMDVAHERMVSQFQSAFDDEGINEEGSVAYHQLNIAWWNEAAARVSLEQKPFPPEIRSRLEAAAEALAHLVMPNGRLPQIGDGARGSLRRGLNAHCDFVASGGEVGRPPTALVRNFTQGYYTSRSGWGEMRELKDESHLILRHGKPMIGHAHEDRGSVHLYAEGTAWLVDSGFHSYQKQDPIRTHLKSREAHNVASLTGVSYTSPTDIPVVAAKETSEFHYVEVEDTGYEDHILRRRVIYLTGPKCWIVQDVTLGDSPVNLRQLWHADVGVKSNRHDRGYVLRRGNARLVMSWLGQAPRLQVRPATKGDLRGWIGTKWKTLEAGSLITAEASASARGLVTLFSPGTGAEQLGIVHSYVTTAGVLYAILTRGGRTWSVRVEQGTVQVEEL